MKTGDPLQCGSTKKITFISDAMGRVEKNVHPRSLWDRFVCAGTG